MVHSYYIDRVLNQVAPPTGTNGVSNQTVFLIKQITGQPKVSWPSFLWLNNQAAPVVFLGHCVTSTCIHNVDRWLSDKQQHQHHSPTPQ
jgi:hypothetical protein